MSIYLLDTTLATGAGQEEPVLKSPEDKRPTDWSADGRFILYQVRSPKTGDDLWVLPLEGDRKPVPFVQMEFRETQGAFSPDGRWIAYTSDESGVSQVYVQSWPPSGAKWQVSTTGGGNPRWRRDGRQLYYINPGRTLTAVDVNASASFQAGIPQLLFSIAHNLTYFVGNHYALSVRE